MTDTDMRVLKTATCKSVSGKSTLTYQIGLAPDSSIHFRITKNTGAGFFNNEWIALKDIEKALAKGPKGQPLNSFLLQPVFTGKSTNSSGFMAAILKQEKILGALKGRRYEILDPEGFDARMEKLVTSKGKAPVKTRATPRKTAVKTTKASTKKAAIKKRAVSRRKAAKPT